MERYPIRGEDLKEQRVNIYNFSSQEITDGEISLFNLGPKFVPAKVTPAEDTLVDILRFTRKLLLRGDFFNSNFDDNSIVRPKSCYIPKSAKNPDLLSVVNDLERFANEFPKNMTTRNVHDNLTPEQREGFLSFKRRRDILFFKADKGSAVVLLNELFYRDKILEILNNSVKYEKLTKNVDYSIFLKLGNFAKKWKSNLTKYEFRAITRFDYRTTNIYGLAKIHKSKIVKDAIKETCSTYLHLKDPLDLKFRLIFGGPKSPCSVLGDMVNSLLEPFRKKVKSSLKDVYDLLRNLPVFQPEDLPFIEIVLVDVKSMYESLDQKLGIPALWFFLNRYKELLPSHIPAQFVVEAMIFVLNNNTGYFNGEFYRQITGTATGIKPAPPYADLAMGYLEVLLYYKLRTILGEKVASYFWQNYRRFLDDGIIFWDKRLCDFNEVFDILNSVHPTIEFTMERSDIELKYLDVLIYKTNEGFKTVVKTKDTDSGTFVHYDSYHPKHCLENIPYNMARRVRALTDEDDQAFSQMMELKSRLMSGAYPEGLVNSAIQAAMKLSTGELRKTKDEALDDDVIAFVHTFDRAHPDLLWKIKGLMSKLYTSLDCIPIFGNVKIIDSRREPSNLLGIFQFSRFDESGSAANKREVTRCGSSQCGLCEDIIEGEQIFFKNAGFHLRIGTKMDCTVRNVIYAMFCGGCNRSYIGESVCLRERANSHRFNSKLENIQKADLEGRTVMEVSRHLQKCGKGFKICPIVKVKEECKILRLVMENYMIKLLKPDLNAPRRNTLQLMAME